MITSNLTDIIKNSTYLVALSGAGISTESGVSDFRGPNGVWTRRDQGLEPLPRPHLPSIQPNRSHYALTKLFEMGILKFLISQNVDNLHLKSGIDPDYLVELHGNHNLFKCSACDSQFTGQEISWDRERFGPGFRRDEPNQDQPDCPYCGGRIVSTIVNFGDPMPAKGLRNAIYHSKKADVFLVVGSTLVVQPAASLPVHCYNNGGKIVIINQGETPLDDIATLKINQSIGEVLEHLINELSSS